MQRAATKPIHAQQRQITTSKHLPQWERARGICQQIKVSNSTLWHWAKTRDDFPKPVKAGPRVTLFDLTAINQWLESQKGAA